MKQAALFGFIAGSALLIGAVAAVLLRDVPERHQRAVQKVNKSIMAFGAGVLLCSLSFDLMEKAYQFGGFDHVTVGFIAGALFFVIGDLWLDRSGSSAELLLGALLDGIPESAVIGIGLVAGKGLGQLMMIAVFLSNIPEGLSGASDMMSPAGEIQKQYTPQKTLLMWGGVTLVCAASSVAGYRLFGDSSESTVALMLAVAAGAILAMVAHTMIPEAFRSTMASGGAAVSTGRKKIRLIDKVEAMAVIAGFLMAFVISHLTS